MRADTLNTDSIIAKFSMPSPGISDFFLFSTAIASETDKNVLSVILAHQLYKLFNIRDYSIYAIGDNKKTFWPVLYDAKSDFAKHPDFKKMQAKETIVGQHIFELILTCN